jgi:SAM-dependent methyltransferase
MTPDELAAAYEGLEDAASFADRATLERYRAGLLDRTAPQAQFVAGYLGARARVLEVACGNGRLLIDLARRGTLAHGLGVDLARSRIAFARAWAADEQIDVLQFDVADALDPRHEPGGFSGALCVTGAFGYFEPLQSGAGARLTRVLLDALEPGGRLFLELYPHSGHRRLLAPTRPRRASGTSCRPKIRGASTSAAWRSTATS